MESILSARSAVLILLAKEEASGRTLIERIGPASLEFVRLHEGRLYPLLKQMERVGLVKSRPVPNPTVRGGRPQRIYSITPKGRKFAREHQKALLALANHG